MSLSLGEKLRQAREERGISISEVAEQTRISSHYLESIENDDYKPLPGGIFNKGFVKSYARFIGFDEQEALQDYARLATENEIEEDHPLKVYKPEVLTDDLSTSSMVPTLLFAGVILALMTGGILFVVNYIQNQPATPTTTTNTSGSTTNTNTGTSTPINASTPTGNAPTMANLKVEFRALTQPIRLVAISDGNRTDNLVPAGSAAIFEPKDSLTLNFNRWNVQAAQLTINGKQIALPSAPSVPKSQRIDFTINKDNIAQIWTSAAISTEIPPATPDANTNTAVAPSPVATPPPATPTPRPTAATTRPTATPTTARTPALAPTVIPVRPTPN